MVVLLDDHDREGEGDVVCAADAVTPEIVAFMAREACGLLCLSLEPELCDTLGLQQMQRRQPASQAKHHNQEPNPDFGTAFTVSIEAAVGVTTGISAQDRAHTIAVAVDPASTSKDLVTPGHIFPLRSIAGGTLSRAGHTEAVVDLARLAGRHPSGAICEIMNPDGTMARTTQLIEFAGKHDLKVGTIADLISYRLESETTIHEESREEVTTEYLNSDQSNAKITVVKLRDTVSGGAHTAIVSGTIDAEASTIVRVHQTLIQHDLLGDLRYASRWRFDQAMQVISEHGGVLLLLNTEQARAVPGQGGDESVVRRVVGIGSQILRYLGVGRMTVLGDPVRYQSLSGFGLKIDRVVPHTEASIFTKE